jgi:tRNA uridine 5-carbamoylmethylation protein Kti12
MNNKKENFKRIAENRTNKIIDLISKLHNLSNSSFYEYTDKQIDLIFNAIQNELDRQKKEFMKDRKKGKKRFEL